MADAPPESPNLRLEVLDKTGAFLTAAFGLVAALAWNQAIQDLFASYFPPEGGLGPKFLYAFVVTIIAVVVIIYLGRAAATAKERLGRRRVT